MSRRRNPVTKNIKDYLVPIIGWILMLILLFSIFTGDWVPTNNQAENQVLTKAEYPGLAIFPSLYRENPTAKTTTPVKLTLKTISPCKIQSYKQYFVQVN